MGTVLQVRIACIIPSGYDGQVELPADPAERGSALRTVWEHWCWPLSDCEKIQDETDAGAEMVCSEWGKVSPFSLSMPVRMFPFPGKVKKLCLRRTKRGGRYVHFHEFDKVETPDATHAARSMGAMICCIAIGYEGDRYNKHREFLKTPHYQRADRAIKIGVIWIPFSLAEDVQKHFREKNGFNHELKHALLDLCRQVPSIRPLPFKDHDVDKGLSKGDVLERIKPCAEAIAKQFVYRKDWEDSA